jgi:hypothetical protein
MNLCIDGLDGKGVFVAGQEKCIPSGQRHEVAMLKSASRYQLDDLEHDRTTCLLYYIASVRRAANYSFKAFTGFCIEVHGDWLSLDVVILNCIEVRT